MRILLFSQVLCILSFFTSCSGQTNKDGPPFTGEFSPSIFKFYHIKSIKEEFCYTPKPGADEKRCVDNRTIFCDSTKNMLIIHESDENTFEPISHFIFFDNSNH